MKIMFKYSIWVVFFLLVLGNIYVFISGIKLSDEINKYEVEINRLKLENSDIAKRTYDIESFQYSASMAARLDFNKDSYPLVIDNFTYALNR